MVIDSNASDENQLDLLLVNVIILLEIIIFDVLSKSICSSL